MACISAEATTNSQTFEVNRKFRFFLSFVKTSSVRMCRVTVSVLRGSVISWLSQLLGQTVGWKVITDRKVMEGRERKRTLQVI